MTLEEFSGELSAQLRAHYPLLYVLTSEEERLERVLSGVAGAAKWQLVRWNGASGFAPLTPASLPDTLAQTSDPAGCLRAINGGPERTAYLLEDFHLALKDAAVLRQLKEALRALPQRSITLIISSPSLHLPEELAKDVAVLELPYPSREELGAIIDHVVASFPEEHRPELAPALRERMQNAAAGLTENEARRLFAKALLIKRPFTESDLGLLLQEKKQLIRQSQLLEFFESGEDMSSIGGLDELKKWLQSRERAFGEEARAYGLPQPKGLMLLGVQGCGKSLTSKVIANLWKLPLLRLDFGAVFSAGSGGPDENLRRALRIAESVSPAVLWVDEIEKGLAGLDSGSATAGETSRVLGSFITWMQEKKQASFVVATANSIENLPPELLRKGRFDEIFFVDLPNAHERKTIFEIHLTKRGRDPGAFDCEGLAAQCEKFSGAEIEESIVSAMYEAFAESREVNGEDVHQAIKDTVPLAVTQEERIEALKDWARNRARRASLDTRMLDVFGGRA